LNCPALKHKRVQTSINGKDTLEVFIYLGIWTEYRYM